MGEEKETVDTPVRRRRFTVDEYECMGRAGILHEDDRVELLDGEVIVMAAVGSRHVACVMDLAEWFTLRSTGRARVSVQNPVRLSSGSEPEPDIAILRLRPDRYIQALPGPEDVLLLIEVADTSLRYDRETKLPLYAAAGIPEVWIVDLESERVLVYRSPRGGGYQYAAVVERGGTLTPESFPALVLPIDDILG